MQDLETFNYREILSEYLLIRKELNPHYSLRSFASDLDLPSSNLSNVLNGKQGLSKSSAEKIAEKLKIQGSEKDYFVDLVQACDARSKKEKQSAQSRLNKFNKSEKKNLQEDYFKLISEWYYYAILELVTLSDFKSDHKWIALKLGLTLKETNRAMDRLVRLGLLTKNDDGYSSTNVQLDTSYDVPSYYIKKHNAQILNKASEAIIEQDISKRELSTLTIAINEDDISFVKDEIRKFKSDLDKKLMKRSKEKGANRVYSLAIQFFDLLKGDSK